MGDEVRREDAIREQAFKVAIELKAACRAVHEKQRGPGGAAVCICGMGCGGSSACSALGILRNHIRYGDLKSSNPECQQFIDQLRNWL